MARFDRQRIENQNQAARGRRLAREVKAGDTICRNAWTKANRFFREAFRTAILARGLCARDNPADPEGDLLIEDF